MLKIALAYNALLYGLRNLSGGVIFILFLLIVTDIFVRLAGFSPWIYTSGVVEYGLLWFAMLAAPYLVREKGHVFVDAVTQILPAPIQRLLAKMVYIICICASVTFFYFSAVLLIEAIESGEIDIRGEDMPLWSLLLPIPLCFFLVTIEFGRFLLGFDNMYGERTDLKDNV